MKRHSIPLFGGVLLVCQSKEQAMTPTRAEVDALMKRCQIGVGGRHALDNAHSIMAECYGTLGALMLEVERLNRHIAAGRSDPWPFPTPTKHVNVVGQFPVSWKDGE